MTEPGEMRGEDEAEAGQPEVQRPEAPRPEGPRPQATRGEERVRVVVVDDDSDVQDLLEFMLEVDGRFRVVGRAGDATEALTMVEDLRPDAVVLDLQLPGMDGLTALPIIRRVAPDVRIVVFSAFPDPFTLVDVLQRGADGYLNKSATWMELIPTLATLCERATPLSA